MHQREGITVTGTGEASAPPDLITVNLGVSVVDLTVAGAVAKAAEAARRLVASLASEGITGPDTATTAYNVAAEHDYSNNTRRLVGYRVNNTMSVKIRELDRAGEVIDRAIAAAGDSAVVNDLRFSIEDPRPLEREARDAAWADARAIAGQLADLAGRELGHAVTIMETSGAAAPFPAPRMREMFAAADVSTPIEGGTTTVRVSVAVRFGFADDE